MRIMTSSVHPDEPCEMYFTGPKMMPGYSEDENPRMIEQVFVYRNDTIACYEQDFGPAGDFLYAPPLMMPSFGTENVGLMQWHGERHRNDPKWGKRIQEYKESSTLMADIVRQDEQRGLLIHNRSQFGPRGNFQRNGWSRARTARIARERREQVTKKVQF